MEEFIQVQLERIEKDLDYHARKVEENQKRVVLCKKYPEEFGSELSSFEWSLNYHIEKVEELTLEQSVYFTARDLKCTCS